MPTQDQAEENSSALQGEFFKAIAISTILRRKTLSPKEKFKALDNACLALTKKGIPPETIESEKQHLVSKFLM